MSMQKVSGGWKIATIILGIILLIVWGSIASMMIVGSVAIEAKNRCNDYCYNKTYESFSYDYTTDECACYIGTEIKETTFIITSLNKTK